MNLESYVRSLSLENISQIIHCDYNNDYGPNTIIFKIAHKALDVHKKTILLRDKRAIPVEFISYHYMCELIIKECYKIYYEMYLDLEFLTKLAVKDYEKRFV